MPTRRPRTTIENDDLHSEQDEIMRMLISMKNDNQSYQMIADELSTETIAITPSLVRKVALGFCKSPKIEMALGLREETATVPLSQIRKYPRRSKPRPKRERLIIPADAETIAEFDAICEVEGLTRRELQVQMMRRYEAAGVADYAELEY